MARCAKCPNFRLTVYDNNNDYESRELRELTNHRHRPLRFYAADHGKQ